MYTQKHFRSRISAQFRRSHSISMSRCDALKLHLASRKGFGLNEVIGIAAGIIIAVVVVIPGLQGFAGNILDNLSNWWNNMSANVFATP